MKTLEFAINLNKAQIEKLDRWLETLKWVWNKGLELCIEFDRYSAWDKHSKAWVPCCPRFGEEKVRWVKDGENWIAVPYSPIANKRNRHFSAVRDQIFTKFLVIPILSTLMTLGTRAVISGAMA